MAAINITMLFCASLALAAPVSSLEVTPHTIALGSDEAQSFWLLRDETLPIIELSLIFQNTGGAYDSPRHAGRAQLAAQLLEEGTQAHPGNAFRLALEASAIELGVGADDDHSYIHLKCLSQHFPKAIALLQEMLIAPEFSDDAVERVRKKMLSDLRYYQQRPEWYAKQALSDVVFAGHPYAIPAEGTAESLAAITVADAKNWHQSLTRKGLLISAAGDVDAKQLRGELMPLLQALPAKLTEESSLPPIAEIAEKADPITLTREVPQTVVMMALPALPRNHPDFYAQYVMNHILGGSGLTSRLSAEIRQQRGLAYHAGSSLSLKQESALLITNFATRNEAAQEATETAKMTLANFAKQGVTREELTNAIDYLTGSFPLRLDGLEAKLGYLDVMQLKQLGADYLARRNAYFRAVTVEDVNRVAAKLLAKTPIIVMVGGKTSTD